MIGFLATLIILIGFLQKNELKIRQFNFFGAFLFTIYGVQIDSIPVWLMNLSIMFIQIYHILRIKKEEDKSVNDSTIL